MTDNPSVTEQLAQLTDGLLWMSESDYPWEVVSWDVSSITPERLLELTDRPPDTPVEVVDVDAFFAPALREQSWHGAEERETVRRYRQLVEFLKENLCDLAVYRVGKVEIDVYVLGTADDKVVGIATTAVET